MFKRADDQQQSITRAWAELEQALGSLRGRRFYGVLDPESREYRACVELRRGDDPQMLELELGTLPGGRYGGSVYTESRRPSTPSSHRRSSACPKEPIPIAVGRASSSTGGATRSISYSRWSELAGFMASARASAPDSQAKV